MSKIRFFLNKPLKQFLKQSVEFQKDPTEILLKVFLKKFLEKFMREAQEKFLKKTLERFLEETLSDLKTEF